ncbi:hypothetical protein SVA_0540 [Sulfurifustis variabilis]|uniref:Uncharacterized protein n=1 Tax=Sulfurifustis variabilis TaxID=1675686 RepID=A0A1B4VAN4_9GAMM|nr:hypothetical protein [Sulfurifustis variabilis]BAU47121.1 hypothetical protein SVA_0540 [Sulfurifustis variabilis]
MSSLPDVARVLSRALVAAPFLAALWAFGADADPVRGLTPVKRHPLPSADPFVDAQIRIARLRQTADQLRLLASQPRPANLSGDASMEYARHEMWLRQAESRVSTLADEWEKRLRPLAGATPARAQEFGLALDLNGFFQAQSVSLQTKLRREGIAAAFTADPVRTVHDSARVVIGQMNGAR